MTFLEGLMALSRDNKHVYLRQGPCDQTHALRRRMPIGACSDRTGLR